MQRELCVRSYVYRYMYVHVLSWRKMMVKRIDGGALITDEAQGFDVCEVWVEG